MNKKALEEKKAAIKALMSEILNGAVTENRAMTADEITEYDKLEAEVRGIDETISRIDANRDSMEPEQRGRDTENRAAAEEKQFLDFIMGRISEIRAGEQNITLDNNSAIIPETIANRIIKAVKERSPILARATIYSVKGTLKIPVYGDKTVDGTAHNINVAYGSEFTALTADAGAFTSVDLAGYLVGALTLIGRSVENNSQFNVVDFIIDEMADRIADFLEKELLVGTGASNSHCTGATNTTNTLTAASSTAITADELIDLQAKIKSAYQKEAAWYMNTATFGVVRKLKDNNGRYLLQDNISQEFPYILLGKPVFLSDNMPAIAAGAKSVLYGDARGLAVNLRENLSIQVLREAYATAHALGVVAWMEVDSKVVNNQMLACLVQKS